MANSEGFYSQTFKLQTNVFGRSTFSQDWSVEHNNPQNRQPGSSSKVLHWNLPPKGNASSGSVNRNPRGVNILNQNNNFLPKIFQNPLNQNLAKNLPALANPMNSSADVRVSSAGQDDFSLSLSVEGGPNRGNSSKNPTNAATSILGKRSSILPSSIQEINKQARNNTALMIHDSLAVGRDRQSRSTITSRRGRKPDSQKYRELAAAQERFGDGDLYTKITRGTCMPSQMTNTDLHRMGMSNLLLSNSVTPTTINWSGEGLMNRASSSISSSSGALPMRNDGLVRSYGGGLIPGNSSFQKKWAPVNFQGNTQGTEMNSSSNGQNNQSFLFRQSSQTGLLGDIPMSSSFATQNNQVLPFLEESQTDSASDRQMTSSCRQNYENFPILEASEIDFIDNPQTRSFPFVEGSQTASICEQQMNSFLNGQNNQHFTFLEGSETGIFDDPQLSSFFNEQNHQSFPTFEQSQAGTLCDFGMPSSSNGQNNQSFQGIPFLAFQTGIQSGNPQETNVLHDTRDGISVMLDSPIELESSQIDPAQLEQYNAELLAAAVQEQTETPQQPMDSEDHQQLLVDCFNSFESPPRSSFSLGAPNDAGLNVQTFDVAATLGNLASSINAVDTNDVTNIATTLEEDYSFDGMIDWPDQL